IPTTKRETFSSVADNQTAVTVRVFQGERTMANDNRLLGQFNLEGIQAQPRGMPQIEVTFDIDVNGILNVSAKDKSTGKETSVKIEQSSGLSESEIEKMQKDAEAHAQDDKQKRELAEAKNLASRMVHETEKQLNEHKDKLDESSKSAIEASLGKVNTVLLRDDLAAIKSATEELAQASQALLRHMQDAGGGAPESDGSASGTDSKDDDVIDAEFEKKD
ncbi:MAG: Hsp70 family protein, partial [Planctomycetota bacterium]|nr:Hsp70 family protein [Planctomycetota bacterium]